MMSLLNIFAKEKREIPKSLPPGSFTVNRQGNITASTLPSSFPQNFLLELAEEVIVTFKEAREVRLPLTELAVNYPEFKLAARELSGGAIIFFIPR
jgi:hypothetical protein